MKKIASILILVFALSFSANAQKRGGKKMKNDFTVAQQATLAVKKMTLALDLSTKQERQMMALMQTQIADKVNMRNEFMKMKKSGKKPTSQERFNMANTKLDKQIAFKKEMKEILNKDQYEKFSKMAKKRGQQKAEGRKRMSKKRMSKKRK